MTQNLPPIGTFLNNQDGMYSMIGGRSATWGIDGYQVSKVYQDHNKLKELRTGTISQLPSQKTAKKGHYLDMITKQNTSPGPKYDISQSMVIKTRSTAVQPTKKKTYIDQILNSAQKYKFPSPDSYKIVGDLQNVYQKSKKLGAVNKKYNDKISFITDSQYDALKSPGPGEYNPHEIRTPLKENHFSPKQIRQLDEQKTKKYNSTKTIGPQYSPIVPDTFSYRTQLPKKYEQNKSRLQNQAKSITKKTKKNQSQIPGPGQYNVVNQWRGKGETTKRSLHNSLSFGASSKIYY